MARSPLGFLTGAGAARLPPWRLLPGALGLALLFLAISGIAAGAQGPPGCIPINTTSCFLNGVTYTSNPNALYSNATVNTVAYSPPAAYTAPAAYAPTYTAYTAPTSGSGYPPNTVISSYFDPRYCGNGAVSIVTDQYGNLINVCTSSGVRIYPAYGGFYGYPYGYTNGYYVSGAYPYGCPVGNYSCLAARGIYHP